MKDLEILLKHGARAQANYVASDLTMDVISEEAKLRVKIATIQFRHAISETQKKAAKEVRQNR